MAFDRIRGEQRDPARVVVWCAVAKRGGRTLQTGFTIIELLVIAAILSVLVAMLLPGLGGAKELARRAKCAANLHQIGASAHIFATENNDALPPELHGVGRMSSNLLGYKWLAIGYGRLFKNGLISTTEIFYCPSAKQNSYKASGAGDVWPPDHPERVFSTEYVFTNYFNRGADQFIVSGLAAVDRIRITQRTMALISDYENSGNADPATNHTIGVNCLYTDAHVEFVLAENMKLPNGSDAFPSRRFDSLLVNFGGDSSPGAGDGTWTLLDGTAP